MKPECEKHHFKGLNNLFELNLNLFKKKKKNRISFHWGNQTTGLLADMKKITLFD